MEDLAYELDLRPWDESSSFWEMTPLEFEQTYRGYLAREDRTWFISAWVTAHLMAPHIKGGKPPKLEKLLGPHWPYSKARKGR